MSARVPDVMTTEVVAVRADASFKEIAAMLRGLRVSAFPVLDDNDKVIGVVSEADLLPKEALEAGYEGHRGWRSARRHRSELAKAVSVTDGVVTLDSTPEAAITGHKIAGEVRHMEGVVAVRERVSDPPGGSVGGEGQR